MKESRLYKLKRYLRHGPFSVYWTLYDFFLSVYVKKIKRENYIGIYVKVISPSEIIMEFGDSMVGYGYNRYILIKLGFKKKWCDVDLVTELLNHEVLHQVLTEIAGHAASIAFDNVHVLKHSVKPNGLRTWVIDFTL